MSLERCDQDIFDNGQVVAITGDLSKEELERICQEITKGWDQPTDWHFAGGRGVILTLGDPAVVRTLLPKIDTSPSSLVAAKESS